jgi:hypothetical protein
MQNRQKSRRLHTVLVLVLSAAILVIFIDPAEWATGFRDNDPYLELRARLPSSNEGKVLLLSSFDDFYSISTNYFHRVDESENFIEKGYDEVLRYASQGDKVFNSYLIHNDVTHVVVPLSSAMTGSIRYKWGTLGSIKIKLTSPYFKKLIEVGGMYPVVLYEVISGGTDSKFVDLPPYKMIWTGIRPQFYELIREQREVGLYSYAYSKHYEEGLDVNWVFQGENAGFRIDTQGIEGNLFSIEIVFVAAYGSNAPPQKVRIQSAAGQKVVVLTRGLPSVVNLDVTENERVEIRNVLPCNKGASFAPEDNDARVFCYGISDIRIKVKG